MTTSVLCYGLGPIGLGIARLAAQRAGIQIVAALDSDPAKTGHDLGDLLGGPPADIIVTDDAEAALATEPDIALHSTAPTLSQVLPELEALAHAGIRVVSTCPELAYPWATQPQTAVQLDRLARAHGISILGTGINPGYAMDALPLILSAPCATVRAVQVIRVADVSQRRDLLPQQVGVGLTPDDFAARSKEGGMRHIGLHESLYMLAGALGWQLEHVEYRIEPIIAQQTVVTPQVQLQSGLVAGVRQVVTGRIYSREVLRLDLQLYVGATEPRDEVKIDGNPPIHMRIDGGIQGDIATAAMVVNAVPIVMRAAPGLATMADVGVVHWRG
jgi:4-hydroxy-tetrahydrodipicolinate reductase